MKRMLTIAEVEFLALVRSKFFLISLIIMPVLLGEGLRFFEHLQNLQIELETVKVIQTGPRIDLIIRIVK